METRKEIISDIIKTYRDMIGAIKEQLEKLHEEETNLDEIADQNVVILRNIEYVDGAFYRIEQGEYED